jgi:hypothetical protein
MQIQKDFETERVPRVEGVGGGRAAAGRRGRAAGVQFPRPATNRGGGRRASSFPVPEQLRRIIEGGGGWWACYCREVGGGGRGACNFPVPQQFRRIIEGGGRANSEGLQKRTRTAGGGGGWWACYCREAGAGGGRAISPVVAKASLAHAEGKLIPKDNHNSSGFGAGGGRRACEFLMIIITAHFSRACKFPRIIITAHFFAGV